MATLGTAGPDFTKAFQPFADASFNQAKSRLDPTWNQNRAKFEQTLVNRGIMPGNEAYTNASESFERAKTDAYDTAQRNSLADALAAQGQAFGQNLATGNFNFQNERADTSDLFNFLNYGSGVTQQNNATLSADQQRAQALLGLIPGLSPQGVDTSGAINAFNTANTNKQNNKNAQYQAWAQLASAFLS